LRGNFAEIPSLPEQTPAKTTGFGSRSEGKTQQSGVSHFVNALGRKIILAAFEFA
jgi:hypothetical protein